MFLLHEANEFLVRGRLGVPRRSLGEVGRCDRTGPTTFYRLSARFNASRSPFSEQPGDFPTLAPREIITRMPFINLVKNGSVRGQDTSAPSP